MIKKTKHNPGRGKWWLAVFGLCITIGMLPYAVQGAEENDSTLQKVLERMDAMQKRIDELEQRNQELEKRLESQEKSYTTQNERVDSVEGAVNQIETRAVRSKFGADLYGHFKLDAAYDTSRTDAGNFNRWVISGDDSRNDDQFNLTASESRFGLRFHDAPFGNAVASGRVEVDFYGGGAENKANPMMRHAYLQLDWPDYDFSLLAGQTADVISPLVPSTLNYSVGWWTGNIGYRRPQLQARKRWNVSETSSLSLQAALARTIGDTWGFHPGDTGEDAGFPSMQARLAYTVPLWLKKPVEVGVSGHWGQEEYDIDRLDHGRDFDSWSMNLDLLLPLMEKLEFKGELWTGENLDAYLGGINQGVNQLLLHEIAATGGWAALSTGPWSKWTFTSGVTIDDPQNSDLNAGDRTRNMSIFGNAFYAWSEAVQWGLEVSYWDTKYHSKDDGDNVRVQTSFIYKF
ncbi:MAG: hypothetical protein C4527_29040 [Candidatus Omnitrophota bacterium]|jgi:hypothetical protein|nr:MAG: hypothetical protein C4527_29040 [Candidatus Omnitrophota bacterium]